MKDRSRGPWVQEGSRNQPSSAAATESPRPAASSSRTAASARLTVAAIFTVVASPTSGTRANEPASEPTIDPSVFAV